MKAGSEEAGTTPEVVFALYKPHEGKDEELRRIMTQHLPVLRRLELITDRPAVVVRSRNGTYIEIFEWRTAESAGLAHHHPDVAKVWEAMGAVCDFPLLESLEEGKERFPHFEPVSP
jgi:hypothetical protein